MSKICLNKNSKVSQSSENNNESNYFRTGYEIKSLLKNRLSTQIVIYRYSCSILVNDQNGRIFSSSHILVNWIFTAKTSRYSCSILVNNFGINQMCTRLHQKVFFSIWPLFQHQVQEIQMIPGCYRRFFLFAE